MEFRIGDFSIITQLTVKTLHFYHTKGLLIPSRTDHITGYRYYDENSLEQARRIILLRELDFSISEISEILSSADEDKDTVRFLEAKLSDIRAQLKYGKSVEEKIQQILHSEKEKTNMNYSTNIEIKKSEPVKYAAIRYKGKYGDIGIYFGKLSSKVGRYINGKSFAVYYDNEYKEDGADIAACFPVKKFVADEALVQEELPGQKVVTLIHKGSYESLSQSYEKLFSYLSEKKLSQNGEMREFYLRGPGWIFRGNPKKYITEIQIPVE